MQRARVVSASIWLGSKTECRCHTVVQTAPASRGSAHLNLPKFVLPLAAIELSITKSIRTRPALGSQHGGNVWSMSAGDPQWQKRCRPRDKPKPKPGPQELFHLEVIASTRCVCCMCMCIALQRPD